MNVFVCLVKILIVNILVNGMLNNLVINKNKFYKLFELEVIKYSDILKLKIFVMMMIKWVKLILCCLLFFLKKCCLMLIEI